MKRSFRKGRESGPENNSTKLDSKEASRSPDRFGPARIFLSFMIVFTVLCLAVPLIGSFSRFESDETARLVNRLDLSDLSIVPSGRRPRAPESAEPSVNLDFTPFSHLSLSDPKFLAIQSPEFSGEIYGNMP